VNAILSGADLREANLRKADLTLAVLHNANLSGARLFRADLHMVDLGGVTLRNARLQEANLRGARGVTNEQLQQQTSSLEGAIMPNGQKYEDWLKSKGRGEEGKSSGPS
jgi:uncharacterized protein YjbI with pentapeptide repeats